MRQRVVPLTDVQVKNAKPKAKDYKLSDGQGLYLFVRTTGGKPGVFLPQTPHHPACGSAPGGSQR